MNIVNEDIIKKILCANENDADNTVLIKWDLNNKVVKSGNNYMSEVCRLTIKYEKNGTNYERYLILKVPFNSAMYEIGKKFHVFQRELTMYTEILPQLYAIDGEYFWPRFYYVDEKHSLFLKDLSQSGYILANRSDQLDFEHCCYALKCLAKFHGLSVKVERSGGIPELIRKDPLYNHEHNDANLIDNFLSGLTIFYDNLHSTVQEKYSEQIEHFKSITWHDLVADITPSEDSFNVLSHGDCWTSNMMFKYDKYGIIKKAKLLDFQICRWGSPALDLIHFTITSMQFDVYVKYFDLLLTIYLETLNKILKTFDCGKYTMEELKEDIEKRYKFAIYVLTCLSPVVISDAEKPVDLNEAVNKDVFDTSAMDKRFQNKRYIDFATKWFLHIVEKDIFKLEINKESLPSNGTKPVVELNEKLNEKSSV